MRFLRVILVLGAFVHLSGGHWGVLQCIAWTNMLVDYSASDGILEGARMTFDGEHPCAMCKSIASAKQEDSKRDDGLPARGVEQLSLKDLRIPESVTLRQPAATDHAAPGFVPPAGFADLAGDRPPLPPPRGV